MAARPATPPPAPAMSPTGSADSPSPEMNESESLGGGGDRRESGDNAVTAKVGIDSTVKPDGSKVVAASFDKSEGPSATCVAWASSSDEDTTVITRRTEAASTDNKMRLFSTFAAFAKAATISSRTDAV